MVIIMNEAKSKKTTSKAQRKDNNMKNTEIEKRIEQEVAKNDEAWLKRMLLLVLTMIIALLGID